MIFAKTTLTWQIIFILLALKFCQLFANPGEDFLNAVISQLKEDKFDTYLPLEDLFEGTRRSAHEYKIKESSESQENSLDQSNADYKNQNLDQNIYPLENQPSNPSLEQNLEQFNNPYDFNGVQNSPQDSNLPAQHLEAYAAGIQAFGPINPDSLPQYNLGALGANDPLLFQNNGQLMGNEVAQNEPLVPMNYYFNPSDNTIDDNLLDEAINAMKTPENLLAGPEPGKKFVVEPLFVAMAGFVGIAMIFMSAVLFLPKLITPPPVVNGLRGPQELAALTKLAVEAMEGNDCTERIACEVGRAMRSMQVGSQPIKMIEVILPTNMAKQLAQIRKAVASKQTCKLIHCKKIGQQELKQKIANKKVPKTESKAEPKKS